MMRVQSATFVKRYSTLENRLHLHWALHPPVALLARSGWIYMGLTIFVVHLVDKDPKSPWTLFLLTIDSVFFFTLLILDKIWQRNIIRIAEFNDVAAVGPLLDLADVTIQSLYLSKTKPMPEAEAIVLTYLPALLARMPAGDGPALTPSQKSALIRLCRSRHREYFSQPGLREKIEAMAKS